MRQGQRWSRQQAQAQRVKARERRKVTIYPPRLSNRPPYQTPYPLLPRDYGRIGVGFNLYELGAMRGLEDVTVEVGNPGVRDFGSLYRPFDRAFMPYVSQTVVTLRIYGNFGGPRFDGGRLKELSDALDYAAGGHRGSGSPYMEYEDLLTGRETRTWELKESYEPLTFNVPARGNEMTRFWFK